MAVFVVIVVLNFMIVVIIVVAIVLFVVVIILVVFVVVVLVVVIGCLFVCVCWFFSFLVINYKRSFHRLLPRFFSSAFFINS